MQFPTTTQLSDSRHALYVTGVLHFHMTVIDTQINNQFNTVLHQSSSLHRIWPIISMYVHKILIKVNINVFLHP
jgi:hypothetical protein